MVTCPESHSSQVAEWGLKFAWFCLQAWWVLLLREKECRNLARKPVPKGRCQLGPRDSLQHLQSGVLMGSWVTPPREQGRVGG